MSHLPLPDKKVSELNAGELQIFRQWIGHEPGGGTVPYPTPEEKRERTRRERWKRRYAGRGAVEPRLLIRAEQLKRLRRNARIHPVARKWREQIFAEADEAANLPVAFWAGFISELGPWNCRGNFCPHCIGKKSGEALNWYFWDWDWRDPEKLRCPHCGHVFPDARYPEQGVLELPRLGQRYTFYLRPGEVAAADWRLGDQAARYMAEPIHVSFSGNLRAMKLAWALGKATPLSLAYAISRQIKYARAAQHIFERMAAVYPGYPLHSYLQDTVDADPGYAVEHADALPTVFKRNACISAYDGRNHGFSHAETTTQSTRVATGLWGSSRIAPEMSATAQTFVSLFQAYDLVKAAIPPEARRRIEQDFLLEFYLDVKAYTPITNKAGPVRAARVAFGLVYDHPGELKAGIDGFHAILDKQFYPDGSLKEAPVYGHKPIGEDLWRIPEMLRGHTDLYRNSLYSQGIRALAEILTPADLLPPLDDSYSCSRLPARTKDIARLRCGIPISHPPRTPSDFAIINDDLAHHPTRAPAPALNKFYPHRRLACLGFGAGPKRLQMYVAGTDGLTSHRHYDALNLQVFAGRWEVFPDLGYLWDHPGKQWATASASHNTVTVDEKNLAATGPGELLAMVDQGKVRHVDLGATLEGGITLRRAVTLLRKSDGLPIVIDVFDVTGGLVHDYNVRAQVPLALPLRLAGRDEPPLFFSATGSQDYYVSPQPPERPARFAVEPSLKPRRQALYQQHSYYPLRNFLTGGAITGGWQATWSRQQRRVTAHVLTGCDELVTYQSPAWRSQKAVAAEPNCYDHTLLLRQHGPRSRFVVVYEVAERSPKIDQVSWHAPAHDEAIQVTVSLRDGSIIAACIPNRSEPQDVATPFSAKWTKS